MQLLSKNIQGKTFIFLFFLLTFSIFIFLAYQNWAYDDPFITFRYAKNIAQGIGFVYNPGEKILSTTTPLFALLLALIFPFWHNLPQAAVLIGAISLVMSGIVLWNLAQSWETPYAGWAGLLLLPTFPLLLSTLGSEIPLYLAFCLSAIAFFAKRKYSLAAVFSALAFLTRADGILIPFILVIYYLWQKPHQIPWKPITIFLLLTLPWLIFAWLYFGSPIPATLAAKQHQGAMTISQYFIPGSFRIFKPYANKILFQFEIVFALLGIWFTWRHARRWVLLFIWTILYILAYTILNVPGYFWYYAPLIPSFIVLIGLGIEFTRSIRINNAIFSRIIQVLPAIILIVFVSAQALIIIKNWGITDKRYPVYSSVGKWINQNTPQNTKVATLEVGIIGYYADRVMIDFSGLLQPDIVGQLSPEHTYQDAARWALKKYKPEFVIVHKGIFPEIEENYLANHCNLVKQFPGDDYNYRQTMQVFACISD